MTSWPIAPLPGDLMFKAKDAMRAEVVTIFPSATLEDAIRLLLNHKISGAPVVDQDGTLVGIISEHRLLQVIRDPALRERRISGFMTKSVIDVGPDTLLAEV